MNGLLSSLLPKLPLGGPRIAVLEMYGPIGPVIRGPEFVRTISALAQDQRVRSVVIDVDSPGGSAPVADSIYRALRHLSARKPTLAYIRGAGLSGGYLIACGASKVVTLPTALVGSIGVILVRPVVQELMERVGVKMVITKEGRLKDMFQPFREPTAEEQEKVQDMASEMGRVPRRLQYVRPRRPLLERLLARGGASLAGAVAAELESRLATRLA